MNEKDDPDKARGLYRKFHVERLNPESAARHQGCRYFVLDLTHDVFAPAAIEAYIKQTRGAGYVALADDLEKELPDPYEPEGAGL